MGSETNLLFVLPMREFNEDEFEVTKKILEQNSIGVRVVANEISECYGMTGDIVESEYSFEEITVDDFEGVVFIGGPGVENYFKEDGALSLAKTFFDSGKIVAALGWAPVILAKAGILNGKRATITPVAKMEIENAGGTFTNETVTVDENIITSRNPDDAYELGQKIVEKLL